MRDVINQLHQITSKEEEDRIADANPRVPIIMGDFTNWKPRPFVEICDYAESMQEQFDPEKVIQ